MREEHDLFLGGRSSGSLNICAQQQELEDDDDSAFGDVASSTDSITSSILEYRTIHGRTYHSNAVSSTAQYW